MTLLFWVFAVTFNEFMVNHSLDYYNTDNTDMRSPLPKSRRVIYCERFEPRSHFNSPIQDYVYPDDQIQPTFEFMYFQHSLDYYNTDMRSPVLSSRGHLYWDPNDIFFIVNLSKTVPTSCVIILVLKDIL